MAEPLVALLGGDGRTADLCVSDLRISALGLPSGQIELAGEGYLREAEGETSDHDLVAPNAVNVVLEVLFVYGFDWGLPGRRGGR